ncbi:MAG: hypothetical protein WBB31_11205 [Saprospiraceae bacterium]
MKQDKSEKGKKPPNPSSSPSRNYKVFPTPTFLKDAKKLLKKYPKINDDFLNLAKSLKKNPEQGENLGGGIYKIRMDITEKSKGKSGCARVAVQVIVEDKEVYVLRAIDKGEFETFITEALKNEAKRNL